MSYLHALRPTITRQRDGRIAFPRGLAARSGVTLVEVLFAIGIVIVGLFGVASLLPLAARNAEVSNESNEGQAYAQRYYAEFVSRGFNRPENWVWFNDAAGVPMTTGSLPNSLRRRNLCHQCRRFYQSLDLLITTASFRLAGGGAVSTMNRHAICIDPGFYADALTLNEIAANTFGPGQAYRPGLFPYYQDNFVPTSNPAAPVLATGGFVNNPRLLRVGLHDPSSGLNLMSAAMVNRLFLSVDDLAMTKPEDKSLPPFRITQGPTTDPVITAPALRFRTQSQSTYSWLATLCPREFGLNEAFGPKQETYYTLSIVVMRRRDRGWFVPLGPDKREIPQGERLVRVDRLSGNFTGGDGGSVRVSASTGLDDTIRSGDWIMFTRDQNGGANRAVVCRWYRVIGVDLDPTFTFDTSGNPIAWSRDLILEGPDWVFDAALPTEATLLSNVVTVFERVIPVE